MFYRQCGGRKAVKGYIMSRTSSAAGVEEILILSLRI